MGIFIYASTATGKTTCAKKYKNVIDMESTSFKYLNEKGNNEARKSLPNRVLNPLWPNNYFEELEKVKDKFDYILISDDICDEYLHSNNYEYWQVYPALNLKDEFLLRCKQRGNNQKFINYYNENWKNWYYQCKNDKFAKKHIELTSGQYLEDVLPRLK